MKRQATLSGTVFILYSSVAKVNQIGSFLQYGPAMDRSDETDTWKPNKSGHDGLSATREQGYNLSLVPRIPPVRRLLPRLTSVEHGDSEK